MGTVLPLAFRKMEQATEHTECAPHCPQSPHDSLKLEGAVTQPFCKPHRGGFVQSIQSGLPGRRIPLE